eukprot:TRINITY_DN5056_c0_g1_i1.p2 TRINITY_DN5056_c0_g1~~TRINITY_DN5056_c0_g1_i1.p2  ORF type:complete len:98 (+),score=34.67 TRINITY_DN5056_c0_g1_i1:280-573(+)
MQKVKQEYDFNLKQLKQEKRKFEEKQASDLDNMQKKELEMSDEKAEILRQQLELADEKRKIDKQISQLQHIKKALQAVAAKHEANGGGSIFNLNQLQ